MSDFGGRIAQSVGDVLLALIFCAVLFGIAATLAIVYGFPWIYHHVSISLG